MNRIDAASRLRAWFSRGSIGWRLEIGVFSAVVALGLVLLLRQFFALPYWLPFIVAGIGSAWVGGRLAGWTCVLLSTLAVDYFFNRPYYSLAIDPDDVPYFIAFAVSMMGGNWFGTWRRATESAMKLAREHAESGRRIAELRWQAVFDNSVVGTALADEHGVILSCNRCFAAQFGVESGAPGGRLLRDCFSESASTGARDALSELLAGRRQRVEFELQRQTDQAPQWLRVSASAVAAGTDFPRFITVFCEDVTEYKRAGESLVAARAELAHASRLTTLGELTASIAHELNQPLAAIVTNGNACLRWLAGERPNLPEAVNTVNWIMRDARRASDVIARVRSLLRKNVPHAGTVDFNEVVTDSLDLIDNELRRRKVSVSTQLDPALPAILGERVQLQQVFLNLALNAIEAMAAVTDRPRQLRITTAAQKAEAGGIVINVIDNGPGVAEADLGRLFTAFFTTKAEGTGLGLWISKSIIENHAGRLVAGAAGEHGMRFSIELPCEPLPADDPSLIAGEDFAA